MVSTFIKLDRNLIKWRWFNNSNALHLWIYILLSANISEHDFENITIHRGELVTSYESLSKNTGLTTKQVRTALSHLKKTGEVAVRTYPKFSVISVLNYNLYQGNGQAEGNQWAVYGQRQGNQKAKEGQQYNNEIKKECKNEIMKECESEKHARGKLRNVFITDDEYNTFRSEYPFIADNVIDELSLKIATGDSRYQKGHIGHLYIFAKNYTMPKREEHKPSYDIDLAMKKSLMLDPTKTKRNQ